MIVSRRRLLQGSLLCAAGIVHRSSPALAEEFAALPTADERKRMAGLATDFMNAYNVPGLSVAIATKGKPVYVEAFGVADRESGEALTPQHTDSGLNSVLGDDYPTSPTLQSLMKDDAGRSPNEQITIEHLLTHTTGAWAHGVHDPLRLTRK